MKIFRVQTKYGEGPFIGVPSFLTLASDFYAIHTHPSPWRDGIDHMIGSGRPYKCGCDSIQMLSGWFNAIEVNKLSRLLPDTPFNNLDLMAKAELDKRKFATRGFLVAVYEVPDDECEYGNNLTQLAYPTYEATLIEMLPIDVLFS